MTSEKFTTRKIAVHENGVLYTEYMPQKLRQRRVVFPYRVYILYSIHVYEVTREHNEQGLREEEEIKSDSRNLVVTFVVGLKTAG